MDQNVVDIASEGNVAVAAFKAASISDVDGIAAASQQIKKFVDENRPQRIVFDFERVKFFSSQVLGLLLDVRADLQKYGGDVALSAINPQLHRVFSVTNLDRIFSFFPEKESAVKAATAK